MNLHLSKGRRDRYLWYLYDFANSIVLIGILYYFSLWAVVERGMSQWIVSLPVSLSTLILLFVMPRIARSVDKNGSHKKMMLLFSCLTALSLLCIAFLKPTEFLPYMVFVLYFLFYFCYQSGYVFFTSFLKEISDEQNRTKVSGLAQLWGQVGNLVGVLLSFATITFSFLGVVGKQQVFLWSAIIFILLLVPFYWFRKDVGHTGEARTLEADVDTATIKKVYQNKKVFWFLLTYIFYADAMMTISFFVTLYLSKALHFTDTLLKIGAMAFLLGTMLGALLTVFLQKYNQERVMRILFVLWPISLFVTAFLSSTVLVIISFIFVGLFLSMVFAVCRSFYSSLIPLSERAEYFSVYVIFERMGAVFGPLIWSTVISSFVFLGESTAYRIAMVTTAIITLGSAIVFRKMYHS